jgi:hypothetical protein
MCDVALGSKVRFLASVIFIDKHDRIIHVSEGKNEANPVMIQMTTVDMSDMGIGDKYHFIGVVKQITTTAYSFKIDRYLDACVACKCTDIDEFLYYKMIKSRNTFLQLAKK